MDVGSVGVDVMALFLPSLQYHSFEEAISILQQVSATVAVGEAVSASEVYLPC